MGGNRSQVPLQSALLVLLALALGTGLAEGRASEQCKPAGETAPMPRSASAYAAMCEPHLGVAPTVDCSQGARIRIRQDGREIFKDPGLHACDDGSLQIGDCMPGSSLQRYEGKNADGTARPGVVWVSFCRHDGRDDVFNVDIGDSVQMIGYNYETGATCFFESGDNSPWTSVGENNRLLGVLPGPDDPEFDDAYMPAGDSQCVRCHQADPFIHNPWIKSARLPENPRQPVVPARGPRSAPHSSGKRWLKQD